MAYTPHVWVNGELITPEKLNDLEAAAAQAAQPGPKGDPGEGLTGTTTVLEPLAAEADATTIIAKVNEIIETMKSRGISTAG